MPPARSRVVVDDARSDISNTNVRDRVNSTATGKGKKASNNALNGSLLSAKATGPSNVPSAPGLGANGPVDSEQDHPHIDWSTLPMHALQNYRSTYRLQIPSAYTRPHAELLYNSCDIALRAPSKVLARKKAQDLKAYHKRQAQQNQDTRAHTNGVSKSSKVGRVKDKERKSNKNKDRVDTPNDSAAGHDSLGAPLSPTSHPSQQESNSISAENASRSSRTASEEAPDEQTYTIPPTLNLLDPEATIIGSTSANALYTSIRKHFNAQQLNEAETIARFSYVIRQQGSPIASRTQSLAQRSGPLPPTTAELIASTAAQAAQNASSAMSGLQPVISISAPGAATTSAATSSKNTAHAAHSLAAPRTLAGNHIEAEGSYGDGRGHIMGTTSCGRQVKMSDSVGGGGTFRLRFRPASWGQEVVGNRAPT